MYWQRRYIGSGALLRISLHYLHPSGGGLYLALVTRYNIDMNGLRAGEYGTRTMGPNGQEPGPNFATLKEAKTWCESVQTLGNMTQQPA